MKFSFENEVIKLAKNKNIILLSDINDYIKKKLLSHGINFNDLKKN